jgi:radical SAM superfamily enzyme YgiQ (UPF0313 family)
VNGVFEAEQRFSPVGPLYIAAALEGAGRYVDFREYQLTDYSDPFAVESFYSFVKCSCDVVCVSCYSDFLPVALLALERLKMECPGKTLILGGEGPTGVAEEILHFFPFVDIVVKGEGERTIVELLDCLDAGGDLSLVHGISFKGDGGIVVTPQRPLVEVLDELPLPALHKVDLPAYQMVGMTSSRGCPFQCTFCDVAPFWRHRFRARGVADMIRELKVLVHDYGQAAITFYDELFTFSRQRVYDFCDALEREGLAIEWSCLARVDSMDEALMERMASSGCTMVSYGVESGSDSVQRRMKKGLRRDRIESIMELSLNYFNYIQTFFVWGFPFETMEDFQATMDLVELVSRLGTNPTVGYLAPFPMSRLYRDNRATLRFSEKIFSDSHPHTPPEAKALIKGHPTVFPGFYVWESELMEEKYEAAKRLGMNTPFLP